MNYGHPKSLDLVPLSSSTLHHIQLHLIPKYLYNRDVDQADVSLSWKQQAD